MNHLKSYTDDHYAKRARTQGFRARSFFKLEEIDQKFNCIKKNQLIVDLGAAPGSWLQYCSCKTKGTAKLYGVDLQEIKPFPESSVKLIQKSAFDLKKEDLPVKVDVLMSDMAPKTTGIHDVDSAVSAELVECALSIAVSNLSKNGIFIAKYLQGSDFSSLKAKICSDFKRYNIFKPKSSRSHSSEIFFIAFSKKL